MVDLIGLLPGSCGHDTILNVVDTRSKELITIPVDTTLSIEGWATLFVKHIYQAKGLPWKIISDQGAQFVSRFLQAVYHLFRNRMEPQYCLSTTNRQSNGMSQSRD